MRDIVDELGFLALGTRCKRIGESLQGQAQELLWNHGLDIPAAHFPLLAALDRFGPLGATELSLAVGVSQPAVSRSLRDLKAAGLVESKLSGTDRRTRHVRLSRKGRKLVRHAGETVWPVIEAAVAQVCEPLKGSLLDQLATLEVALESTSLQQRAEGVAVSGKR